MNNSDLMITLKQLGTKLKESWSNLSMNQKVIGSGAMLLVVIAFIILLLNRTSVQPMEVLYADLIQKDAAAIVAKLEEERIPYRLEDEGTTILVPANIKYTTRLKLAAENLPQGQAGLELFRETSFGETQMDKRVKYQEALQGELARTIQSLDKVKAANVILAMPEDTLFSDDEEPTKASVVIRTEDNQVLNSREVQGIINLVSNSVKGLTTENVVIVDQYGNLVSDNMFLDSQNVTNQVQAQMLIKRSFEKEKEKAIQTMLDRTLGQDNSVVRVHADLIFDSREQRDERYFHDEDGPFIRSESTTEESSTQTNVEPAGIPGIDTNIPEYLEVPNTQGESTYEKETRDINYEINRTETVTRFSLGDVDYNYLTVSVLVNRSSPQQESLGDTEEERIQKIRNIVASATGLRENGNNGISLEDQISVAFIDFYTEPMPEPESTMVSHLLQSPYFPVLIALMALMLLIIMVLLLRKRSTGDMQETGSGFETIAEEELRLEDLIDKTLTPEEKERQRIRQEVERFIEENPEDAVQVVRIWLSEDSR
ncbi:MAG: flagellar M-ring protein FliF [Syntrophomonadaceae bacterium]|nr:flagellar M-ring protein FliF [Syntrophomonadaceae bacterium]HAA10003.1 flagellar M-ring protein FliF [Syntrophomonas sp.]